MFNFDLAMQELIEDIVENCTYFNHIDPERIIISAKHTKAAGIDGLHAQVFPLRFKNGAYSGIERVGRRLERYKMEPLLINKKKMLYVLYFYLPRFLNLPFTEKMTTIFHELYHISPEFDGDLRRFPGKNYMHGSSLEKYDSLMSALAKDYLFRTGDLEKSDFLRFGSRTLKKRYGNVIYSLLPEPESIYLGRVH